MMLKNEPSKGKGGTLNWYQIQLRGPLILPPQKTIWLFTRLEDNNNVVGWGEATLQGRENEILQNKKGVLELIVNSCIGI